MSRYQKNKHSKRKLHKLSFESLDILLGRWHDGTFGEIIDDWRWILSYSKRYKGAIVFYTFLGIFSATMGLGTSVISMDIIDVVTGKENGNLFFLIAIGIGSIVFNLLFDNVTNRISTRMSIYINNDIQADIFDKIMDAEWLEISKYPYGDILNRFNGDVVTVSSNAISWLPTIIIALYNFTATFVVIWHYDKIMALLAFGTAPVMLAMSKYFLKKQRDYGQKVREMNSNLMAFEVETFYNMDTVKSFGIMEFYGRKMRAWQERYKEIALEYNWFTICTNVVVTVAGAFAEYLAFGYCLYRLWRGQLTYGMMTMFLQQRSRLDSAFNNVVSIIPSFLNSSVSAHRIRELVELKHEVHIPESKELDQYVENGFSVELNDLDFSYVEGNQVITQSHFEAHPGEIVALVGPSGEGKTTMIRLILGLVRPDAGRATIRSVNVKHATTTMESRNMGDMTIESEGEDVVYDMNAETRHLFAYVPQGNTILQGTIAENMRMVKEDASDEEIMEALKLACAWDFVEKMPGTINCAIGERGRGFSEGQAQRIAIARAILRDAPVLLLDEATSALDVATERQVLRNIIQQKPNKVCIVTTHRPSVLNMCQRVYRVMDRHVTELSEEESSKMAMDF